MQSVKMKLPRDFNHISTMIERKSEYDKTNDDHRQPRLPLLEQIHLLRHVRLPNVAEVRRKIKSDSAKMAGEKRCETDDQPFFEIERLKQNFLHQLERFPKRLEDFDLGFDAVHERHFKRSIAGSKTVVAASL